MQSQQVILCALLGASSCAGTASAERDALKLYSPRTPQENSVNQANTDQDKYVGMWVTADGYIRHELLRGGRYDEARGRRSSAYRGSYSLTGDHIDYVDDTGFTADGEFRDGVLYHAGMVLRREPRQETEP